MKITTNVRTILCAICIATLAVGCQSSHKAPKASKPPRVAKAAKAPKVEKTHDQFTADANAHPLWRFAEAQSVSGACDDAMLYARHFDGEKLNSLGMGKLELMLACPDRPATIYLNLAKNDAHASAHRASVEQWLKDAGIAGDAVAIKDGATGARTSQAEDGLSRLWKTESPQKSGASSNEAGADSSFKTQGMSPESSNQSR